MKKIVLLASLCSIIFLTRASSHMKTQVEKTQATFSVESKAEKSFESLGYDGLKTALSNSDRRRAFVGSFQEYAEKKIVAAVCIQRAWRNRLAKKSAAALTIQNAWRRHSSEKA